MLKIGSVSTHVQTKRKKYDQYTSQSRLISQLKKCNKNSNYPTNHKKFKFDNIQYAKTEGGKMLSYMLVRINSTVE